MFKYYLLVGALIIGGLAFIFFWVGWPKIYSETAGTGLQIHAYDNPAILLDRIELTVFYFVPADKIVDIKPDWQNALQENLTSLRAFHDLQTQSRSELVYAIHPEPVIGQMTSLEYDTTNTSGGNPDGLRRVAGELLEMGFLPENNIGQQTDYQTVLIVYEGLGAAASEHVAFINNRYLTDELYQQTWGLTFLAHEFYHTLGVPDTYETAEDIPLSADLMGLGRYRPLRQTYLDAELLARMGL